MKSETRRTWPFLGACFVIIAHCSTYVSLSVFLSLVLVEIVFILVLLVVVLFVVAVAVAVKRVVLSVMRTVDTVTFYHSCGKYYEADTYVSLHLPFSSALSLFINENELVFQRILYSEIPFSKETLIIVFILHLSLLINKLNFQLYISLSLFIPLLN